MNTDTQMRRRRHLQQIVLSTETHGLDEEERDKPASPSPLRWKLQWKTAAVVLAVCGVFAVLGVVLAPWKSGSAPHPPSIDEALAEESASAQPASSESASALSHSIGPQIVLHVTGEVRRPGVIRLVKGTRVMDAIEEAGGFTEDADTQSINLARVLVDGEQLKVRSLKQAQSSQAEGNEAAPRTCVDVASADAAGLQNLDGVGPSLANRIITYRQSHPISGVEDLDAVPGIGPSILEKIRQGACQ